MIDLAAWKRARAIAQEIEVGTALVLRKFDRSRWPDLEFPRFTGVQVAAAVSPDCSYRLLRSAIRSAKKELLLYIYNVSAEYLLDELAAAHERGVKLRAMYDANQSAADEVAALKAVGAKVQAAPSDSRRSVFTVCHQKFLVVDRKSVVVESANWATSSIPKIDKAGSYKKGNREWLLRADSAEVASWFADLFDADWDIPANAGAAVAAGPPALAGDGTLEAALAVKPAEIFDLEAASKPVELKPVVSPDNYRREVAKILRGAKKSIWLQQQYILAGKGVRDLLEIVRQRKEAGVRVRILVSPKFKKGWDGTVETLTAFGLEEDLKASNLRYVIHCHNKGVLVDSERVVVSSTNWSENSIYRAREAGVAIRSREVAKYFEDVLRFDWSVGLAVGETAGLSFLPDADLY